MPDEQNTIQLSNAEISDWIEKIRGAEEVLEENHLPLWRSIQKDYSAEDDGGTLFDGLEYDDGDVVKFNFLLSNANTILPGVISANPYIYVKPRRPGDRESARIAETALNYVWREIDGSKTVRSIVLDTLLFGIGVGKVGYDGSGSFYTEEDYDSGPEKVDQDEDELSSVQRRQLRSLLADDGLALDDEPADNPSFTRIAPWNLIVPPGYTEIGQCPWVCERMLVRLDDLRNDERFDVPDGVEADSWLSESVPASLSGMGSGNNLNQPEIPAEYVTLYEIRYWRNTSDGMRRHVMWLIRNPGTGDAQDSILRHVEDPIEMKGYPYEVLRFVDVPNDFYSTKVSDLASIKGIADRLNDEWAYILRHHRLSSRRKFVAAPGALESGQLSGLLESDEDMAVAEIPASVARIQDALMLLPEAPPPSTTPMVIQGLARLMYEISGIDTFQRGGGSRKGTTATEVAIASAATKGRVGMRLEATERLISKIGRKILAIIRQYWDEVRYLRIDGEAGEEQFIAFTASDIQGFFDVNVQAGSTIPTDPAEEQRAFMGLLQTIQGVAATLAPLVQGGMLPPSAIQSFMDQAFRVWRQDKRALTGPLSQLQGAAMGAASPGQPPEEPQTQGVEDTGMNAVGQPLAGTGPREVAPGSQDAVLNRFQN
tara:strand:- start:10790 stop:12754 length:1965 start_codon:yes stop_codon:yes gene_type:complete